MTQHADASCAPPSRSKFPCVVRIDAGATSAIGAGLTVAKIALLETSHQGDVKADAFKSRIATSKRYMRETSFIPGVLDHLPQVE